ncbi:MutS family protein MSH4 [Saccharomyces eubayanus]|uniref:MutS family protein MSH4 n=1 Tax=Saccharomyces eubayanus TaxID=1080349 RepID=UPI0006C3CF40|nr:MSH4-like protein [Saccharomyces eubayanus]KOG99815.1 MSH4-like protein [Saccharomyces eubayanus]
MSESNLSSFISTNYFNLRSAANSSNPVSKSSTKKSKRNQRSPTTSNNWTFKKRTLQASQTIWEDRERSSSNSRYLMNRSMASRTTTSLSRYSTNTSLLGPSVDCVLCCIYEVPRDVSTRIGLCIINCNTGQLFLSDFMDSQIYIRVVHKLQIYQPTEILIPSNSLTPTVSKLATMIKFNVSETVKIEEGSRKCFNSQDGLAAIEKYLLDDTKKDLKIEELIDKSFALCAASAAISYMEEIISKNTRNLNAFRKLRIQFEGTENTMLIDSKTVRGLELVENKLDKNGISLWKFLDSTSTKMGQRSLRNNILQPLTDKESIEMRLEALVELENNDDLLQNLRLEMKSLPDLDKLFSRLLCVNQAAIKPDQRINYVLLLKETLQSVKSLKTILNNETIKSRLIGETNKIFNNDANIEIEKLINEYINEDCVWASSTMQLLNQRSFAVKSDSNGLLDVSRQIYKEVKDEFFHEVENLSADHKINLDHNYDSARGFYLRIKRQDFTDNIAALPDIFISKTTKKNYIECTTLSIIKKNARLKEVMEEILLLSEETVDDLLDKIASHISELFMIAEAIAILDLVCSFAFNLKENSYTIPTFANNLLIQDSRHPLLEKVIDNFVPNSISSTKNSSSLQIITGCNMSGKSVYLKQVALISIMAQMGSGIPARYGSFPIFKRLHARVCNDTMELTSSNFGFEMKEMAYFLDDINEDTLLILDELGRGSSVADGFCVSLAVTEHLLRTGATVFLSTHFQDIPKIMSKKPAVSHLHMDAVVLNDKSIKMNYHLTQKSVQIENSGIKVVDKIFSPNIIEEAYNIHSLLKIAKARIRNQNLDDVIDENTINQMKRIHNLVAIVHECVKNEKEPLTLEKLREINSEFIEKFEG